jgi:hypothetical protein
MHQLMGKDEFDLTSFSSCSGVALSRLASPARLSVNEQTTLARVRSLLQPQHLYSPQCFRFIVAIEVTIQGKIAPLGLDFPHFLLLLHTKEKPRGYAFMVLATDMVLRSSLTAKTVSRRHPRGQKVIRPRLELETFSELTMLD